MKFSIVTASYNSAKTIEKTLLSVSEQSYGDVEHIVADGRSTDDTANIVKIVSPKAQLFVDKDEGIYDGMNNGIRHATGDVIALLNSDDHYAHKNVLAEIAGVFEKTGADAVFADIAFFDPERNGKITRYYRSDRFSPSRLKFGIMPAHPGMFLRRHIYDKLGLYSKNYPVSADFEFVARMFTRMQPTYAFHREAVVKMLPGGASTQNLASNVQIFRDCLRACKEHGIRTSPVVMLGKYPIKLLDYLN
jgi:glycosyltransferase involved in cell wall biosynthesis